MSAGEKLISLVFSFRPPYLASYSNLTYGNELSSLGDTSQYLIRHLFVKTDVLFLTVGYTHLLLLG